MITTKGSGNDCKILLDLGQTHFSFMSYSIHAPEPTWPGYAPCLRARVFPEGTVPILDLPLETDVSDGAGPLRALEATVAAPRIAEPQLSGHS